MNRRYPYQQKVATLVATDNNNNNEAPEKQESWGKQVFGTGCNWRNFSRTICYKQKQNLIVIWYLILCYNYGASIGQTRKTLVKKLWLRIADILTFSSSVIKLSGSTRSHYTGNTLKTRAGIPPIPKRNPAWRHQPRWGWLAWEIRPSDVTTPTTTRRAKQNKHLMWVWGQQNVTRSCSEWEKPEAVVSWRRLAT